MVIAAFYVMTADVSAEEVALPDDDVEGIALYDLFTTALVVRNA